MDMVAAGVIANCSSNCYHGGMNPLAEDGVHVVDGCTLFVCSFEAPNISVATAMVKSMRS